MKHFYYFILLFLIFPANSFSQWVNLNTGINDNLTGIYANNYHIFVCGENGVYYSTNDGVGSANWHRFEFANNTQEAQIYNNSKFNKISHQTNDSFIMIVGENTVSHKAVIMSIKITNLEVRIIEVDIPNSKLFDVIYTSQTRKFYAVGNNGLAMYFTFDYNTSTFSTTVINTTGITDDLISIGFDGRVIAGAVNKLYFINVNSGTAQIIHTPGITHKDFLYHYTMYFAGNKIYSSTRPYSHFDEITNYDYGPINANVIYENRSSHKIFIGTNHGIFKMKYPTIEWQPSSGTYNIKDIYNGQACGDNGVVLKNTNPDNEAKPYVKIVYNGCCVGGNNSIGAIVGSYTSCEWYIDNVLVSNSRFYSHTFNTTGSYEIKLVVTNLGEVTEDTKTIYVGSPPANNKPYTVLNDTLCHSGEVQVSIDNTDNDVVYTLGKSGAGSSLRFGESPVGNGGTVVLTSNTITESGDYYLIAEDALARGCYTPFSSTFHITVEQTKADFHNDLINAYVNENVQFYQHSEEAVSYDWTFTNAANTLSSTDENPINSFNTPGIHDVSLTASSSNMCTDQKIKNSPYIITQPTNNTTCWDLDFINSYVSNRSWPDPISSLTKLSDGFLVMGTSGDTYFDSKQGVRSQTDGQRNFLVKYDFFGTLKWKVISSYSLVSVAPVVDQLGDIYYPAKLDASGVIIDNTGTSDHYDSSFVKLDNRGKVLWNMKIDMDIKGMTVDRDNNLLVFGSVDTTNDIHAYLDGQDLGSVFTETLDSHDNYYSSKGGILKIDPNGNILWDVTVFGCGGTNIIEYIGVDAQNNYYVNGDNANELYIFDNINPTFSQITLNYLPNRSYNYYMKLNTHGDLQWTSKSFGVENALTRLEQTDWHTDDAGNTYTSFFRPIRNGISTSQVFYYINPNTTERRNYQRSAYLVLKIDNNGYFDWSNNVEEANNQQVTNTAALKMDYHDNKLYVLGRTSPNMFRPENITFRSTNYHNLEIPLASEQFFVARYTPDGVLEKISTFPTTLAPTSINYNGFLVNDDGFYIAESVNPNGIIHFNSEACATEYVADVSENSLNKHIKIYPNPTIDNLNIRIDQNYDTCKIAIMNTTGQNVYSNTYHQSNKLVNIKLNNIHSGIYFVKIILDKKYELVKKLIVK